MIKNDSVDIDKSELVIRDANEDDIHSLMALVQELASHEGEEITVQPAALQHALTSGKAPELQFIIAELAGEPIGFAMCYPGFDLGSGAHGMHLGDIVVRDEYRRQGIGKMLLSTAAQRTLKLGGEWMSFTVLHNNDSAERFYRNLNAVAVEVNFYAFGMTQLSELATLE